MANKDPDGGNAGSGGPEAIATGTVSGPYPVCRSRNTAGSGYAIGP